MPAPKDQESRLEGQRNEAMAKAGPIPPHELEDNDYDARPQGVQEADVNSRVEEVTAKPGLDKNPVQLGDIVIYERRHSRRADENAQRIDQPKVAIVVGTSGPGRADLNIFLPKGGYDWEADVPSEAAVGDDYAGGVWHRQGK